MLRFIAVSGGFTMAYAYGLKLTQNNDSEVIRVAAAGSLTFVFCELAFFPMDSINLQQKIKQNNVSNIKIMQ